MFEKVWEIYKEYNGYTNKQIEYLLMDKGYDELIEEIGIAKKNWDMLYDSLGNAYRKPLKIFDEKQQLIEFLKEQLGSQLDGQLPEEFSDSDCDEEDTCWTTFYHVYVFEKTPVIVYEEYYVSSNKYYGKYDPNTFATLGHKLEVWVWRD